MPVILVLYDGKKDRAYWLYVQRYLDDRNVDLGKLPAKQTRVTLRIPLRNRVGPKAIEKFRQFRNRILAQMKGSVKHGR